MSSSHHYPLIPRLLFLLAGAFILGGQAGKLHSWQKSQAASASLLSESTSWGLSFQKEGERPVGNATINDLVPFAFAVIVYPFSIADRI